MFAGSVASLAVLGAPDVIVLTLGHFSRTWHDKSNQEGSIQAR